MRGTARRIRRCREGKRAGAYASSNSLHPRNSLPVLLPTTRNVDKPEIPNIGVQESLTIGSLSRMTPQRPHPFQRSTSTELRLTRRNLQSRRQSCTFLQFHSAPEFAESSGVTGEIHEAAATSGTESTDRTQRRDVGVSH